MAIELVTAYKGKDHVTAEQWADFNRGIYGDAAILPVGNKMETAIQTANQITVKDGVAVIDGRQVYIGYGESENIAIQSGTQGKLRRDIVVLEYKKEEVSGVETVQFKVITGTPADSDAKDPSVQDMDIRTGVFTSQKPFCRVRLNGTAIEGVDTLIPVKEFKSHAFAAPVNNLTGTNPDLALAATQGREIKKQIDALNSSLSQNPTNWSVTNTIFRIENKDIKRLYFSYPLDASGTTRIDISRYTPNAEYVWMDLSQSYAYNRQHRTTYPISYYNNSDSIFYRMNGTTELVIHTTGDWTDYYSCISLLFYEKG